MRWLRCRRPVRPAAVIMQFTFTQTCMLQLLKSRGDYYSHGGEWVEQIMGCVGGWPEEMVDEQGGVHTHTHTHTHTHIRHSSSLCAFFFLINHGYWCTECWKAESINKRKSFLRGEWLKGRVYPHAVHLSTCACVSACVRLSVCAVCCIHVSNLHISPSSEVSFASCPFVSALLSPDSQSWLVNV